MELGLFPMPPSLVRPAPFLPALSQLQQGAGRGKKRRDKLNWTRLVSRSNLARALGQRRAGFQAASLLPDCPHWGCLSAEGRAQRCARPRSLPLSCVGLGGWVWGGPESTQRGWC